jgi:hypothetical protein
MGSGFRTFTAGEVLTASNTQNYLMDQAVMSFASAAARDAAITAPEENMVAALRDTDVVTKYTGSAWVEIAYYGAWTSYTPTWSATGTAVSLGNGTITGKYMRQGSLVKVKIVLTMGSTTTYGTGFYRFTLPVTPAVDGVLPGCAQDISAARRYRLAAHIVLASTSGDNMRIACDDGLTNGAGPTAPFTWANTDVLVLDGEYEV